MTDATMHPVWCDRSDCGTGSTWHHSRSLILGSHRPGVDDSAVAVRITQPVGGDGPAFVDLTVTTPPSDEAHPAEELPIVLTAERAMALGQLLVSAGKEAASVGRRP